MQTGKLANAVSDWRASEGQRKLVISCRSLGLYILISIVIIKGILFKTFGRVHQR